MATKKAALGRGLNALLPSMQDREPSDEQTAPSADVSGTRLYKFDERHRLIGRVAELEVDIIRPNPYQPRQHFTEQALEELSASIKQLGIIQPITVRSLGKDKYEIISGERRLRAAKRAGLKRVPAYIREADTETILEMAIVENVQREDLNPIEVAIGYKRLIEECDLTQEHVATKVGKNRATIANFIRLLKLPPRAQAALRDREISVGHARALINIADEAARLDLLEETLRDGLSVRQVEQRVRALRETPEAVVPVEEAPVEEAPIPPRDAHQLRHYTDRLRSRFSTQVSIKHKPDGGGRIEIHYFSDEELERLMDLIG
ncbi:MAG: ParB/RepB/Spo0J family partition protein [Bacteroidota bacterium]